MNRVFVLTISVLLIALNAQAQFQINNNSLQVNPSFSGAAKSLRVMGNSTFTSDDASNLPGPIQYYTGSVDGFIKKLKLGVGVYLNNRGIHSPYKERLNMLGIAIAPKLTFMSLNYYPKYTLSPSLAYEWIEEKHSYNVESSNIITLKNRSAFRVGLLFNSDKFFIGASASYAKTDIPNMFFWNVHGGYVFQRDAKSNFSFSPAADIVFIHDYTPKLVNEKPQSSYLIRAVNLNFRIKKVIFGTGLPHAMIGVQTNKFRACVSYTYMTNDKFNLYLNYSGLYTLQVSAAYTFGSKDN